jgi:signal transduction histidine kinase
MSEKYKILQLEDVQADADLIAFELKKSNIIFEHLVVDTEEEYRHALDHFNADIILCDHTLPSFNSLQAFNIIKEKNLSIPFIIISATLSEDTAMKVVREGADDFIFKDRLKRLPSAVINAIRKTRLIVANKELVFLNKEKEKRGAELVEANKELESFTYCVSHDLRAPLRAINGFTQILIEEHLEQLDEDAKGILNEIISNSKIMGQLIDNLLVFSKVSKQHILMDEISIEPLVNCVISELVELEPDRSITINIGKLETIKGDRNMWKQVFINLISNAIKYTGKKKEAVIEIGSYIADAGCTYYVKDNGAGFDMRYYHKMFGAFQRLHSTKEFFGTGIGLAIVQKIVTKHGGKVWAEGKVDEGASFYISLPGYHNEQRAPLERRAH